ncbi:MAG: MerR family transcriptional regulator [Armatimonadetes bacterium]|nr:MerR family transcriptional regulator [Armatimonadota bacterium]
MLKRQPQEQQLELFPQVVLYLSQSDAAGMFSISTRMIQYWESQGLLHPELAPEGRSRKYTRHDLVELQFIKTLVVDHGYSVPALKEKLQQLQAPYYYDPQDAFWDPLDRTWKSRAELAAGHLSTVRDNLHPLMMDALSRLLPGDLERASQALLDLVRDALEGKVRLSRPPRRRRTRGMRGVRSARLK